MIARVSRIACCAVALFATAGAADDFALSRPSAIVVSDDRTNAFVTSEDSGVVSRINLDSGQVEEQFTVGQKLTDLVQCPGGHFLLAVDNQEKCVLLLQQNGHGVEVVKTLQLNAAPLRISISPDATMACVTHQWARHVQLLKLATGADNAVDVSPGNNVDVGFAQQEVVALGAHNFVVADRFGGHLAVIDTATQQVVSKPSLFGHNIRGLTIEPDGENVLVAHQVLSRVARTTFEDVHWGMIMQNVVRRIPVKALLNGEPDLNSVGRLYRLGDTGDGFADPSAVLATEEGIAVLSSGTSQLMIMSWDGNVKAKTSTGRRPTRLVNVTANRFLVANALSDSVSVIEYTDDDGPRLTVTHTIAAEPLPTSDVRSGEFAFFDGHLSHDGWMSCHSCHTDGHSPDLLADTLGDGAYGNPKRIPSLLGVVDTGPWAWNGSKTTLRQQLRQTLTSTMHSRDESLDPIGRLSEYLKTLVPPKLEQENSEAVNRGKLLFTSLGCVRCHKPDAWTSSAVYDVGLKDETGQSEFNPPSLRAARHRRRFFHDGRATSLESVLRDHQHNLKASLVDADVADLVAFLKTL